MNATGVEAGEDISVDTDAPLITSAAGALTAPDVGCGEAKLVADESAKSYGLGGVEHRMDAADHDYPSIFSHLFTVSWVSSVKVPNSSSVNMPQSKQ